MCVYTYDTLRNITQRYLTNRRRMNARIQELENALEQQRSRATKLEKEKNRLVVEIREITTDLENVSSQ